MKLEETFKTLVIAITILERRETRSTLAQTLYLLSHCAKTAIEEINQAPILSFRGESKSAVANRHHSLLAVCFTGISFLLLQGAHDPTTRAELADFMRGYANYLDAISTSELGLFKPIIEFVTQWDFAQQQRSTAKTACAFHDLADGKASSIDFTIERGKERIARIIVFKSAILSADSILPDDFKEDEDLQKTIHARKTCKEALALENSSMILESQIIFTVTSCVLNSEDIHIIFEKFFAIVDFVYIQTTHEKASLRLSCDLLDWLFQGHIPAIAPNLVENWKKVPAKNTQEVVQAAAKFMQTQGLILESPPFSSDFLAAAPIAQLLIFSNVIFSIFEKSGLFQEYAQKPTSCSSSSMVFTLNI